MKLCVTLHWKKENLAYGNQERRIHFERTDGQHVS